MLGPKADLHLPRTCWITCANVGEKNACYCRLGRVLLGDLVRREEEHGPDEALHRRHELGDPVLLRVAAREPEACRLRLRLVPALVTSFVWSL